MTSGVKPRAAVRVVFFFFVEKTVSGLILLLLLQELVCDAEEAEAGRDQHLRLPAIPRAGDSGDAPGKFPTNRRASTPSAPNHPHAQVPSRFPGYGIRLWSAAGVSQQGGGAAVMPPNHPHSPEQLSNKFPIHGSYFKPLFHLKFTHVPNSISSQQLNL